MATLHVGAVIDGNGYVVGSTVEVSLVDTQGVERVGMNVVSGGLVPSKVVYRCYEDSGVDIPLVRNSDIAIDSTGSPTYYVVRVVTRNKAEQFVPVQIPAEGDEFNLQELVGAATIDPADLVYVLTPAQKAALEAANNLNGDNPVASINDLTAGGGVVGYSQDSEPAVAVDKATWWNPLTQQLKVYREGTWQPVAPDGGYF